MKDFEFNLENSKFSSGLIVILLILSLVLGIMFYRSNKDSKQKTIELADKQTEIEKLQIEVSNLTNEKFLLESVLLTEQNKNLQFENQINSITGTVGDLEKLSKTDPELLQKYSKVYFLNENYIPSAISEIDRNFVFNKNKDYWIHSKIKKYLENMLKGAENDDIYLKIISAYRTFDDQIKIKSNYLVTYGSGANQFSADQGYSEHQLGTTIDFTTPELGSDFANFETTEAYKWLAKNAYKYGFILSYSKGNSYYTFEPWHWRFVGTDLARKLKNDDQNFYDLSQREIDEYLISIFD